MLFIRTQIAFLILILSGIASQINASEAQSVVTAPQRIEWHNIEAQLDFNEDHSATNHANNTEKGVVFEFSSAAERSFFSWEKGNYLRVQFTVESPLQLENLTIWLSSGDGLFQQITPQQQVLKSKGKSLSVEWTIYRENINNAIILLEKSANEKRKIAFSLQQSQQTSIAELTLHRDPITDNQSKSTGRTTGFDWDDFQLVKSEQPWTTTLSGPHLYQLEWMIPWTADYNSTHLMEWSIKIDGQPAQNQVTRMQFQRNYAINTGTNTCAVSRNKSAFIYIPAGKHQVSISTDRTSLMHWTLSDHKEQLFYSANQHESSVQNENLNHSVMLLNAENMDDRIYNKEYSVINKEYASHNVEVPPQQPLPLIPNTYFYRKLGASQFFPYQLVIPLTYQDSDDTTASWLPNGDYAPVQPEYFQAIGSAQIAQYKLPLTTIIPPLQLKVFPTSKETTFSLIADNGEEANFRYIPNSVTQHIIDSIEHAKIVDSFNSDAKLQRIATSSIQFSEPFKMVMLKNQSDRQLWIKLSYKNWSERSTDEYGFLSQSRKLDIPDLMRTMRKSKRIAEHLPEQSTTQITPSNLLISELTHWLHRLSVREQAFLKQLPETYLSTSNQASEAPLAIDKQLTQIINKINHEFSLQLNNPLELVGFLDERGLNFQSMRLLALMAAQSANWQHQPNAERIYLERLVSSLSWSKYEGYWAYRFLSYNETNALKEIANALFQQSQFQLASKWYQLYHLKRPVELLPHNALIAAINAGYFNTLDLWLKQRLFETLSHCQPQQFLSNCENNLLRIISEQTFNLAVQPEVSSSSRDHLILNRKLDLYLRAFEAAPQAPLVIHLTGPKRIELDVFSVSDEKFSHQPDNYDWLTITLNDSTRNYLLTSLNDSQDLLLAQDSRHVSGSNKIFLDIPPGEHQVSLIPGKFSALIKLEQQTSIFQQIHDESMQKAKQLDQLAIFLKKHTQAYHLDHCDLTYAGKKNEENNSSLISTSQTRKKNIIDIVRRANESYLFHSQQSNLYQSTFVDTKHSIKILKLHQQLDDWLIRKIQVESAHLEQVALDILYLREFKDSQELENFPIQRNNSNNLPLLAKQFDSLVTKLNVVFNNTDSSAQSQRVLKLLNKSYGWRSLNSVMESDGHLIKESERWEPTSPQYRIYSSLMNKTIRANERLLSKRSRQIISLSAATDTTYYLKLRHAEIFARAEDNTQLQLSVNGNSRKIELPVGGELDIPVKVKQGKNRIVAELLGSGIPWVFFSVTDASTRRSVIPQLKTRYQRATKRQPVKIFSEGSEWFRIDEMKNDRIIDSKYQWIENSQVINLSTDADDKYFRIYRWTHTPNQQQKDPSESSEDISDTQLNLVKHTYWTPSTKADIQFFDIYPFAEQEDGTWGASISAMSRNNYDEDTQSDSEKFSELGWNYRLKLPELDSYFKTRLTLREHYDTQLQTLTSNSSLSWLPNKYWNFEAKIKSYYQISSPTASTEEQWNITTSLESSLRMYWHNDVKNEISLGYFQRELSLKTLDAGQVIDDDVFSTYKSQHSKGLILYDRIQYMPWADTLLFADYAIRSNEDFNLLKPDNHALSFGFGQYINSFYYDIDFTYRLFNSDSNRAASLNKKTLSTSLAWESWSLSGNQRLIQLGAGYDLDSSNLTFSVTFNWNKSHGQGYDDFSPSELRFSNLRRRNSYFEIDSNQIMSDQHE